MSFPDIARESGFVLNVKRKAESEEREEKNWKIDEENGERVWKMREILFRAKTKMIVGTYNCGKEDGEWGVGCLYCDVGKWIIRQFELDRADYVGYEVDPETVCQYTGLTDKNGRKIFEGDIISKKVSIYNLGGMKPTGERMLVGAVIWDESSSIYPGGWSIKAKDEHGNDAVYIFDNGFKIIGNIFDNPGLIGEGTAE